MDKMLLMNSVNYWQDAHTCLYWYCAVYEALKASDDSETREQTVWVSFRGIHFLPAFFFYCGWNKVVVMQCHDGRQTKGTIWANAILMTWCTRTKCLVFVSDAQNNLKCEHV